MSFDSQPIVDELRHLLIGQYRRPPQKRARRRMDQRTTAVGCPRTNEEFMRLSGVADDWSMDDTWVQVKRALEAPRSKSPASHAARYLLYLERLSIECVLMDEWEWRQRRAAEVQQFSWTKEKFRFRDYKETAKFESDIVDGAVTAVQEALLAATQSTAARASAAAVAPRGPHPVAISGWTEMVEAELIRRLERLPQHYPEHLSTSIIAPMLNPHIRDDTDSPGPVPILMRPGRDESADVSELLRSAGARTYVVGGPGTGKSTLLRDVVVTQMTRYCSPDCRFSIQNLR